MPTNIISIHHTKWNCKADLKRRILRLTLLCLPGEKNPLDNFFSNIFISLSKGRTIGGTLYLPLTQGILITFYYDANQICIIVWVINFYLCSISYEGCVSTLSNFYKCMLDTNVFQFDTCFQDLGLYGPLGTFVV